MIPGGADARVRHDEPPNTLAQTFGSLARVYSLDPAGPGLEDYRRADALWALLPIRVAGA